MRARVDVCVNRIVGVCVCVLLSVRLCFCVVVVGEGEGRSGGGHSCNSRKGRISSNIAYQELGGLNDKCGDKADPYHVEG